MDRLHCNFNLQALPLSLLFDISCFMYIYPMIGSDRDLGQPECIFFLASLLATPEQMNILNYMSETIVIDVLFDRLCMSVSYFHRHRMDIPPTPPKK